MLTNITNEDINNQIPSFGTEWLFGALLSIFNSEAFLYFCFIWLIFVFISFSGTNDDIILKIPSFGTEMACYALMLFCNSEVPGNPCDLYDCILI